MLNYLMRRLVHMLLSLVAISIISFVIIQLPPGDYLTTYIAVLEAEGFPVSDQTVEALKREFGLDESLVSQYFKWITNFVRGNMGRSFVYNVPVSELVGERIALTVVISSSSLIFIWLVAFPVGIYSALRQYSLGDYTFTFLSYIGLAIPNFMLALLLMYVGFRYLGVDVGGLFSPEYQNAPWSPLKVIDLLKHLWIPTIVLGTAGTAGLVRIMRANLLDELRKQYVITARSRGVKEMRLILKYPVRVALNPFVSTLGWTLPTLISGATITAIVLNLPTTGPFLLAALLSQDMFLAGSFIMLLSILTVIGTLISDILLTVLDPRIRLQKKEM
jgi:peptide/nickel transport system permease protein